MFSSGANRPTMIIPDTNPMTMAWKCLLAGLIAGTTATAQPGTATLQATGSEAKGIGAEAGVMRRDPSDIVRVGDLYYVWYSKGSIAPGYDATVWYATSPDGHHWTEKGMALAKGGPGGWDGASVFTPNILVAEGRYWLFYTGTSRPFGKRFNPDSKIGIAVADSPDGPWERLATNPALTNSDKPEDFDSHLVDDACLIVRDGRYWLYYKGRQLGKGPGQTQLGVAIADRPEGPYVKFAGNPVIPGNHEVLVWPQGKAVAAMIGTTGPKDIVSSIMVADDGLRFTKTHKVVDVPHAAGAYRPEAFTDSGTGERIEWGVHIGKRKGFLPFIERFDLAETTDGASAEPDPPPGPGATKPNFVVIFTDDQGYADLGCFGGGHVETPRIDRMAAEGCRLTAFYVAAPVCTPSRAALMTGCYPKRIDMATGSGFGVLLAADAKGLNPDETTIAELLKPAGYKTGIFGKWHLGDQPEFLPTRQGFDEFFGLPYSHDIHPFHTQQKKHNFPPLPLLDQEDVIEMDPDADFLTRRITERAVAFIEANKDRPFFLYVPHPMPHRPLHASPPFMKDAPEALKTRLLTEKENRNIDYRTRDKLLRQTVREIDWSVGRILDTLKAQGIDHRTLVIFTSDNGPSIPGKATPLSGRKGSTFEGGMREPTVIRWPGKIPAGGVNDELMTTMDLLPTFARLAGTSLPADRVIDGKDIWPVLAGKAATPHEAFFYHKGETLEAVRSGKWKLRVAGKPAPALYDLETDISERSNVLKDHPDVVAKLRQQVDGFQKDLAGNSRPAAFVKNPRALSVESQP